MRAKVNMLFSVVTPYTVCKDLKFNIKYDNSKLPYVVDPRNSKHHILILSREFVTVGYNPDFQYGNILDFIVYTKGITYTAAFDLVIKNHESRIDDALLSSLKWLKTDVVDYLEDLASLNRGLLGIRGNVKRSANVRSFLADKGLLWANNPQFVTPALGSDIREIMGALKSDEFKHTKLDVKNDAYYILYVYYVNYHTVSALVAESVSDGKMHLLYESKFLYGILGYHTIPPTAFTAILCEDMSELTTNRKKLMNHGRTQYGTVLLRNNGSQATRAKESSIMPDKLPRILIDKAKTKSLTKLVNYFKYSEEVRFVQDFCYSTFDNATCCRNFIVSGFFNIFNDKEQDEVKIKKYVTHAFKDVRIKSEIVEKLKYTGNENLLNWADEEVFASSKHSNVLGSQVSYTKEGYVLSKGDTSDLITNFVVILQTALVFKDSSDVFYKGKLFINNLGLDITIPKTHIQQPYTMLKYLTRVVSLQENSKLKLPIIYDKSYTKYITATLLQESDLARVNFGTSVLGWANMSSEFNAAGWYTSSNGITSEPKLLHPTISVFSVFDYVDRREKSDMPASPGFNTALALITASLCRGYMGWNIPTVLVKDTPINRKFLISILTVFGQNKIFELNTNRRSSEITIEGLSGYPIACYGLNGPDKTSKNLQLYLSQDSGIDFNCDEFKLVEDYMRYCIPLFVFKILKEGCTFYEKISDTVAGLTQEGVMAVRTVFKKPEFTCLCATDDAAPDAREAL